MLSENQILSETNTSVDEKWGCTQSKVVKFNYKWIIENFSFYRTEDEEVLYSPLFFADACNEISWYLRLQLQGDGAVICLECYDSHVRAKFRFSIIDNNKKAENIWSSSMSTRLCVPQKNISANNFVSREHLNKACGESSDDKLTILCDIQFLVENANNGNNGILYACNLNENFKKLLDNQTFCDVILVVGEHEFPAHKVLLAARSPVFAAMFEYDMEESKLNRVTIKDVNHEVFKELLHFIYTGKAPTLDEMADDLLAAADKYLIEELRSMCAYSLSNNLSIETAVKTLVLADLHGITKLKEEAMSCINVYADEIAKTQDWKDLTKTRSHLIAELYLCTCSNLRTTQKSAKMRKVFRSCNKSEWTSM